MARIDRGLLTNTRAEYVVYVNIVVHSTARIVCVYV